MKKLLALLALLAAAPAFGATYSFFDYTSGTFVTFPSTTTGYNVYPATGTVSLPFGFTASTATLSGYLQLFSVSSGTISGLTPVAVGQVYFCNNCANAALCVSTGTAKGAFARDSSPTGLCN